MREIIKPWGAEYILEHNDRYVVKKLFMKAGHRCSLQEHLKKHEFLYILSGKLLLTYGDSLDNLQEIACGPDFYFTIAPGKIHRMEAIEDSYYLESQTPELDDVVRYQDDFGREDQFRTDQDWTNQGCTE